MKSVILWFRRDLRLADQVAVWHAAALAERVLPVFIWDPTLVASYGERQKALLISLLKKLRVRLKNLGADLIFKRGNAVDVLRQLAKKVKAEAVLCTVNVDPSIRNFDEEIAKALQTDGVDLNVYHDTTIQPPNLILAKSGEPYRIYTPYAAVSRELKVPELLPEPERLTLPVQKIANDPWPSKEEVSCDIDLPPHGEDVVLDQLKSFCRTKLKTYASKRNFPAMEGTSGLAQHFAFGSISARTVYHAADRVLKQATTPVIQKEISTFIGELIWRDFCKMILWHYPYVAEHAFKPHYRKIEWSKDRAHFKAWCEGKTGYPIVDAAMRQLKETGWMHNRLRMIVASFLTKDLLINWQWGEAYFKEKLFDYDLSANNANWQWSAGTGADAHPYFRIFNPTRQADRFDPDGVFVARYLPEANTKSYPKPIVDHATQRDLALKMYRRAGAT